MRYLRFWTHVGVTSEPWVADESELDETSSQDWNGNTVSQTECRPLAPEDADLVVLAYTGEGDYLLEENLVSFADWLDRDVLEGDEPEGTRAAVLAAAVDAAVWAAS